ncbi:MAG: NADH-quinone oxidoreductase subunit J [Thermodesulfobacteriota bacterium]|nr:MAG: NADH-quinone oxidoreductase subunit J [Thermodesulfobacteriota bacterium]
MEQFFFYIFAVIALVSAVAVITMRNVVHSALALMICFLQVAAIFILLRAPFLAAVQVFIYVGAVMVLFLFAVMVLGVGRETFGEKFHSQSIPALITLAVLFMVMGLFVFTGKLTVPMGRYTEAALSSNTEVIGKALYTQYIFPFEVVSVLLLIALIGTVVLVMRGRTRQVR